MVRYPPSTENIPPEGLLFSRVFFREVPEGLVKKTFQGRVGYCIGYTRYSGILKSRDPTRAHGRSQPSSFIPLSEAHTNHVTD